MTDEIFAVVSFLVGLFIVVALVSHQPWDPSPFVEVKEGSPVANVTGPVGAWISDTLLQFLGFTSYLIPLYLGIYSARRFLGRERSYPALKVVALSTFSLSFCLLLSLIGRHAGIGFQGLDAGGLVGHQLSLTMRRLLSDAGTYIFCLGSLVVSAMVVVPLSLMDLSRAVRGRLDRLSEQYGRFRFRRRQTGILEGNDRSAASEFPAKKEPVVGSPDPLDLPIDFLEEEPPPPALHLSREQPVLFGRHGDGEYRLPSTAFLTDPPSDRPRPSQEDLAAGAKELERKLTDYGVEGRVARVQPGPIVSMYEFEPAPGVKINKVVSLAEDLAMSMKVERIRVTTLSGKAAIGIEIPNHIRETVYLKEIIASREFIDRRSLLTLALGKDIFGKPMVADLSRMPHLLVAGATGSGKSVAVNAMILSLLYKATPKDLRMVMIDPKMLELSAYRDIPHLFAPVITIPREASGALRKLVFEMESRYRLLAERGVRNIDAYNASVEVEEEQLPYIVVVIDELADLMLTSGREVEDSIARLAQMARAAGIHLILATQRPSVDVLTGVIKANFPARISFQVSSKVDSRTILDANGAEQLIGRGDMLLMSPGSRLVRIHGAYADEDEIARVTQFIRSQGQPSYSEFESIATEDAAAEDEAMEGDRDVLYGRAVEVVRSTGQASISYIQRRLKIGYNRAARIMDLMEEDGIVGPPKEAGKPRDIL